MRSEMCWDITHSSVMIDWVPPGNRWAAGHGFADSWIGTVGVLSTVFRVECFNAWNNELWHIPARVSQGCQEPYGPQESVPSCFCCDWDVR